MHVIGELQIRHSKDRAPIEKYFGYFYRLIDLIQLTALLVFAAQLTISFPNTFLDTEFWSPNTYALSLLLFYKTANCSIYGDASSVTGYNGVNVNLTSSNAAALWSLHTDRIRVAFAMCAIGFVVSAGNRMMMRHNVFFVSIFSKKFRIHKDIVTILDIALEIGGLALTVAAQPTANLLQKYLDTCGVQNQDSVAYLSLAGLFVSSSFCIIQHCFSIIAVLYVGLTYNKKGEASATDNNTDNNAATSDVKNKADTNADTNTNDNQQNQNNNNANVSNSAPQQQQQDQ